MHWRLWGVLHLNQVKFFNCNQIPDHIVHRNYITLIKIITGNHQWSFIFTCFGQGTASVVFIVFKMSSTNESINSIQSWSATWPRIWLQLTSFARPRCETPHRLQCIWTLYTIYWFGHWSLFYFEYRNPGCDVAVVDKKHKTCALGSLQEGHFSLEKKPDSVLFIRGKIKQKWIIFTSLCLDLKQCSFYF